MTTRALLFSGGGDYVDPWHPYPESSAGVADVLRAWDVAVQQTASVDEAVAALAADDAPELFAINAGAGPDPHPDDARLVQAALDHLDRGGGLLVVHLSTGLFPESPEWEAAIGARWIWEVSGHPPIGTFPVEVATFGLTAGIADFELWDERYSRLRLADEGSRVLASHELDGVVHPLVWTRQIGAGRVAVDLLGHDARSFESPEHRELLGRVARWAAGAPR